MDTNKFRSTLINLVDSPEESSAVVLAAQQRDLTAFDFVTGGKFNPFAGWRLARWVREQRVDIIHGHGYKSDLLGLMTAKLAGCRVMTTPHGWSLEKDLKLQFFEKIDRFSFRFMDIVCPLSESIYNNAEKYTKKKVRLIANGVDIDEIRSSGVAVGSNEGSNVIGYIGRLAKSKDIVTLLNAVSLLFASGRKVKLILVGDGDQAHDLIAFTEALGIKNIVEFKGFKSETAVFLRGFDCFVLPSLSEGTPRCIMEAMALSIPVVASDIPGNRLLVSHEKTGLLFPVSDSKKLADCISFMLENPDIAKDMAENGCKKVEEQFSNLKMASEYSMVYEDLIEKRQL